MSADVCYVETTLVHCDGNGDVPGHPRVYLKLGDDEKVDCPYCGRVFVIKK